MENLFNKISPEVIPESKKPEDGKVFNNAPDEIDHDYLESEEESGIIGSGRGQMGTEEFEDFSNLGQK